MKSAMLKYAIGFCVLVCDSDAFPDIITVPSGLNPGDRYRLSEGKPEISEKSLRKITMLDDWGEQRKVWEQLGCVSNPEIPG